MGGGVGLMHAFLQLVYGVRDLMLLPLEQYKKDGRIVRGLQKGTTSFIHSTTLSFHVMSPYGCVVYGKLPHPVRDCKEEGGARHRAEVARHPGRAAGGAEHHGAAGQPPGWGQEQDQTGPEGGGGG